MVAIIVIGWLALAAPPSGSARASAILRRCLAAYDSARTFTGDVTFTITNPDPRTGSSTTHIETRIVNGPGGWIARSFTAITQTTHRNGREVRGTARSVDDGTAYYTFYVDRRMYVSEPHRRERFSNLFRGTIESAGKKPFHLSVTEQAENGVPVFVIQSDTHDGQSRRLTVDRRSFHLISLQSIGRGGDVWMVLSNQVFNRQIPDAVFRWTPPPGYHRARQQEQPTGPGSRVP
jgi:outer membrane lipoprotein-sorting protein